MNMFRLNLLHLLLILFSLGHLKAQQEDFEVPTTNSQATVKQRIAATDIEVRYNRPSAKGRMIFGGLVPYGEVWRTGSDASTKISFSTSVSVNGQALQAGTYELFTIPEKEEWTIIFQENQSQWGSYRYDTRNDALRVRTKPRKLSAQVETFSIGFDKVTSDAAILQLSWEKTMVSFEVSVDLEATVLPKLETSLKKQGRKPYFRAAMFYFENDLGISRAAELMALALKDNPGHIGMLYRYALILEKKGDKPGAIKASEQSLEGARKVSGELKSEYTKLNSDLLKRLKQ